MPYAPQGLKGVMMMNKLDIKPTISISKIMLRDIIAQRK